MTMRTVASKGVLESAFIGLKGGVLGGIGKAVLESVKSMFS